MEKLFWEVAHKDFDFNGSNEDFLEKILKANGIEDVREFLNVSEKHINDPFLFRNMENGVDLYHEIISMEKPRILIKNDPDVDGYTSTSVTYQVTKDINPNAEIELAMSYKKEHEITMEHVEQVLENGDLDLIIVPDAGSGQQSIKVFRDIRDKYNIPVLVLDHHELARKEVEIDGEKQLILDEAIHDHAIVINCQDGDYPNNTLSGVGVVLKFFEAYCHKYGLSKNIPYKYIDLVALGLIADVMDARNLETRYYMLEGLKPENQRNELIEEMAIKFAEEMKFGHTIEAYGWVIAPKINGVTRYGKEDEQYDLLRAMIGEQEDIEYQPRKAKGTPKDAPKPPIEIHSLQKTMARVAFNVKQRQDNAVRKALKEIKQEIENKELDKNPIIFVDGSTILKKKSVTGLVANKLLSIYRRPVVILKTRKDDETLYGGSGRGYEKGVVKNFQEFLNNTGVFEYCEGHPNAFGVSIKKENLQKAIEICKSRLDMKDIKTVHEVDYEIDANILTPEAVSQVANNYAIWGNKVKKPTFAITNIEINEEFIQGAGKHYEQFIYFTVNNIRYVKKYCTKGEFQELCHQTRNSIGAGNKDLKLTLICHFEINEYLGKNYPVVRIKEFYSEIDINKSKTKKKTKAQKEKERKVDEVTIDDIF